MRITTNEAFLTLFHFSPLFSGEIEKTLEYLKSDKNSAQVLSTGAKLRHDNKSYYLDSYNVSELDTIQILDFLGLLEDYWVYLEVCELMPPEDIQKRKLVYQGYKDAQNLHLLRVKKPATYLACPRAVYSPH